MAELGTTKLSVSRFDVEAWAAAQPGFVGVDLRRVSTVLLAQLIVVEAGRIFSTFSVTDELQYLEGVGRATHTKAEEQFKYPPLAGLYKKHFTDAQFLVKNLGAYFGYDKGGNRKLTRAIEDSFAASQSGVVDDEFTGMLAHRLTFDALEKRAGDEALTGEWIVYEKCSGRNIYLTLGFHSEGDARIWDRVCVARASGGFLASEAVR